MQQNANAAAAGKQTEGNYLQSLILLHYRVWFCYTTVFDFVTLQMPIFMARKRKYLITLTGSVGHLKVMCGLITARFRELTWQIHYFLLWEGQCFVCSVEFSYCNIWPAGNALAVSEQWWATCSSSISGWPVLGFCGLALSCGVAFS
jgi:hypothetical protein